MSIDSNDLELVLLLVCIPLSVIIVAQILARSAEHLLLMDIPDARKCHEGAIPMVGGLAMFPVILGSVLLCDISNELIWIAVTSGIIVILGVVDDIFGLSVISRILVQALAVIIGCGAGIWIQDLGLEIFGHGADIGGWGILLTIFCVVGVTNAFNMIDGIDGLASGQAMVALVSLSVVMFVTDGVINEKDWLLILTLTNFTFFVMNMGFFPLTRIFLGDSGSMFLGFLISWTLITYSKSAEVGFNLVYALCAVTIPVVDTLAVVIKRIKEKRSPFSGDRNHLHHVLLDMNLNPKVALVVLLGVSASVNFLGIMMVKLWSPWAAIWVFGAVFFMVLAFSLNPQCVFKTRTNNNL